MAVVEVRGLTKSYGAVRALEDVSLSIEGGVTGLLGPNGAGKSTFLLCVLGLLPDWSGEVSVLDLDARRDRRAIRRKISGLKAKLERVAQHRDRLRHARGGVFTAALVGYTNAGKSSLLKALTGADPFIEDRLFATLDTLTREVPLDHSGPVRLVDTVGFIRKLPHHLVASFRATLEDARRAELPAARDEDEEAGDHLRTFASALVRSVLSAEKSRSIPELRPISTWSAPAMPSMGRMSRASSRKRRFMRLRTTALPTFLETVMPIRIVASSSSRARTSSTNPGMGARLPALAAR